MPRTADTYSMRGRRKADCFHFEGKQIASTSREKRLLPLRDGEGPGVSNPFLLPGVLCRSIIIPLLGLRPTRGETNDDEVSLHGTTLLPHHDDDRSRLVLALPWYVIGQFRTRTRRTRPGTGEFLCLFRILRFARPARPVHLVALCIDQPWLLPFAIALARTARTPVRPTPPSSAARALSSARAPTTTTDGGGDGPVGGDGDRAEGRAGGREGPVGEDGDRAGGRGARGGDGASLSFPVGR